MHRGHIVRSTLLMYRVVCITEAEPHISNDAGNGTRGLVWVRSALPLNFACSRASDVHLTGISCHRMHHVAFVSIILTCLHEVGRPIPSHRRVSRRTPCACVSLIAHALDCGQRATSRRRLSSSSTSTSIIARHARTAFILSAGAYSLSSRISVSSLFPLPAV